MPTAERRASIGAGSPAVRIGRIAAATAIAVIVFASLYFAVLYLVAQ